MLPCLWIENIFNYPCFKCLTDAVAHSTNIWVPTLCQALYSMTGKRQEVSSLVREKWFVRAEGLQCVMPSRQKIFCCCLVTKLCLTLCDLVDYSLPSSTVTGISRARILHWVPFLTPGDSQPRDWICVSCIGRQILYHWATREAQNIFYINNQRTKL